MKSLRVLLSLSLAIGLFLSSIAGGLGTARASAEAASDSNLLVNPSFTDGTDGWTFTGRTNLAMNNPYTAPNHINVNTPNSSVPVTQVSQIVTIPVTGSYTYSAWVGLQRGGAKIGIRYAGDVTAIKETVLAEPRTTYTPYFVQDVRLNKGDQVEVYINGAPKGWTNADDFALVRNDSVIYNMAVNPGFQEGMNGWSGTSGAQVVTDSVYGRADVASVAAGENEEIAQMITVPITGPYLLEGWTTAAGEGGKLGLRSQEGSDIPGAVIDIPASGPYEKLIAGGITLQKGTDVVLYVRSAPGSEVKADDLSLLFDLDNFPNTPPKAEGVAIAGVPRTGMLMTGQYTFMDADGHGEGSSAFRWLESDEAEGPYTPIDGAVASTFLPTSAQEGKYIKFEVTPMDQFSKVGSSALSEASSTVEANLVDNPGFEADGSGWSLIGAGVKNINASGDIKPYTGLVHAHVDDGAVNEISRNVTVPKTGVYKLSVFTASEGAGGGKLGIIRPGSDTPIAEAVTPQGDTYQQSLLTGLVLEEGESVKVYVSGGSGVIWADDFDLVIDRTAAQPVFSNITGFAVDGQFQESIVNRDDKTVTFKMPYGTDMTALAPVIELSEGATIDPQSGEMQNFTAPVAYTVTASDSSSSVWTVSAEVMPPLITLDSSHEELKEAFQWSVARAWKHVQTGKTGVINKDERGTPTSIAEYIPSYWAGYAQRSAFYSRDMVHQSPGAHLAGMNEENFSMLQAFARTSTEEHKWYPVWALNFDGSIFKLDYRSSTNFVREVPAVFELVEMGYKQYLWTGDERYINDPELLSFYEKALTDYVELHDTQRPNGVAEGAGTGSIFAGSPTYNERSGEHLLEAGDGIASQYQGMLAYAGILDARGESVKAAEWYEKAAAFKTYFNEEWGVEDGVDEYIRGYNTAGDSFKQFGKEGSWFMPYKLITEPGAKNDAFLDYIHYMVKHTDEAPKNIEAYTYLPDTFFRNGKDELGWEWMTYLRDRLHDPHEWAERGTPTNGDYPEVSFTLISHTIEGLMGVEPNAPQHKVTTLSRLPGEVEWLEADELNVGDMSMKLRHEGKSASVLTLNKEAGAEPFRWEAQFRGSFAEVEVDGTPVAAQHKTVNGVPVSYVVVELTEAGKPVRAEVTVVSADLWSEASKVEAASVSTDEVELAWSGLKEGATAESFKVLWDTREQLVDDASMSAIVAGLEPGTTYTFKVEAQDGEGNWTVDGPSVTVTTEEAAPGPDMYLSDMDWTSAESGWKTVQRDKNVGGGTIAMNGQTYDKGLGTHASSEIVYELNEQYGKLLATIGPDDHHRNNSAMATSVIFQVFGDGTELYKSEVMRTAAVPIDIEVDIRGVNELRLVVDDANDPASNPTHSDWANWGNARVERASDPAAMLASLSIDGSPLEGFAGSKYSYEFGIAGEASEAVPVVSAVAMDASAIVAVEQAQDVPGTAKITVTNGEASSVYTVEFFLKDVVYVSDLDWEAASSGWEAVRKDLNAGGGKLNIMGTEYEKGLGTHAPSVIRYDLDGQYMRFKSDVGFDHSRAEADPFTTIQFIVLADGVQRFDSGILSNDHPVESAVDISVEGVETLELIVTDAGDGKTNDWANWGNARLIKGEPTGTLLGDISLNGVSIEGFTRGQLSYDIELPYGTADIPLVTAEKEDADAAIEIVQAASVPGTAVITVTKGEHATVYNIHFALKHPGLDFVELAADKQEMNPLLNPNETIALQLSGMNGDGTEVDFNDPGVEVSYSVESSYKSSDFDVVAIDDSGVVSPVKDDAGHWVGGSARVKVTVTADGMTEEDTILIVVRPFYLDYSKTLVMKYFLGRDGEIQLNLDEALEATKKIDRLTRGIPKVVYLVGWQFEGHDSKYPSWDEVNEGLKRSGDDSAEESLMWLMEEAKKYNTTISLHMNMTTAFPDSPLWDEYVAADLIGKVKDSAGTYNGTVVNEGDYTIYGGSYAISYYRDWNSGLLHERIQRLLNLLPALKDGRTIHTDAFHLQVPRSTNPTGKSLNLSEWHQALEGYTNEDEVETMRKIYLHWRSQGLDLTSEFVDSYREGRTFVGLQPMAWHFRGAVENEDWLMNVPASLYSGGRGGDLRYGSSMLGEGRVKRSNPELNGFLDDFALNTLPWTYLNSLERISDDGLVAQFSNDVTSYYEGTKLTIKQGDKLLRSGDDVFIPVLWSAHGKEIMAYSGSGYTDKVWSLPDEWSGVEAVDLYLNTINGLVSQQSNVSIADGTITLSIAADTGLTIVPAGTDMDAVSGIVVDKEHVTMDIGEQLSLQATVQPVDIASMGVVWTSGNSDIVAVDANGTLTGVSYGTAMITARTADGKFSRSSEITVAPEQAKPVQSNLPSNIYMGKRTIALTTETLDADIYYTIGGAEPSASGTLYTGPIELPEGVTVIRMIAVKEGMSNSVTTANAYTIQPSCACVLQLREDVANAQELHDTALEGRKKGEYPAGAKAKLQAAIVAASEVADNLDASSEEIASAKQALASAVETFKKSVNKTNQYNPGTIPPVASEQQGDMKKVTKDDLKEQDGKVTIQLSSSDKGISLSAEDAAGLSELPLELKRDGVTLSIPASVIQALLEESDSGDDATIEIRLEPIGSDDSLLNAKVNGGTAALKLGDDMYEFQLILKTGEEERAWSEFSEPVVVTLSYDADMLDEALLGIYYYNEETQQWEYVGGEVDEEANTISTNLYHFSKYAVLELDKTFTDVASDHWGYRALKVLSAKHIAKGSSDKLFSPNGTTTRAEFTAMLVRALGLDTASTSSPFLDVAEGAWYAEEVAAAYRAGLVNGVTDTMFAPEQAVTREQMAALLVRAYEYATGETIKFGNELGRFADASSLSSWAEDEVAKAVAAGLMQGVGGNRFDASSDAKRIQTAQAIYNWLMGM